MTNWLHPTNKQVYQIRVDGALAKSWSEWFDAMTVEHELSDGSSRVTVLTGALDQCGLHGILSRIGDLNLKLISVTPVGWAASRSDLESNSQRGGK
jgi:hypothetical protein